MKRRVKAAVLASVSIQALALAERQAWADFENARRAVAQSTIATPDPLSGGLA